MKLPIPDAIVSFLQNVLSPVGVAVAQAATGAAGASKAQEVVEKYPVDIYGEAAGAPSDQTIRLPSAETAGGKDIRQHLGGRDTPYSTAAPSIEDTISALLSDSAAMFDSAMATEARKRLGASRVGTAVEGLGATRTEGLAGFEEAGTAGREAFGQARGDIAALQAAGRSLPQQMAAAVTGALDSVKGIYENTLGMARDVLKETIDYAAQKMTAYRALQMNALSEAKGSMAAEMSAQGYTASEIKLATEGYMSYGMAAQLAGQKMIFDGEMAAMVADQHKSALDAATRAGETATAGTMQGLAAFGSALIAGGDLQAKAAEASVQLAANQATWETTLAANTASFLYDVDIARLNGEVQYATMLSQLTDPVQLLGPIYTLARDMFREEHMLSNQDKLTAAGYELGPTQILIDSLWNAIGTGAANRMQHEAVQAQASAAKKSWIPGAVQGAAQVAAMGAGALGGLGAGGGAFTGLQNVTGGGSNFVGFDVGGAGIGGNLAENVMNFGIPGYGIGT